MKTSKLYLIAQNMYINKMAHFELPRRFPVPPNQRKFFSCSVFEWKKKSNSINIKLKLEQILRREEKSVDGIVLGDHSFQRPFSLWNIICKLAAATVAAKENVILNPPRNRV